MTRSLGQSPRGPIVNTRKALQHRRVVLNARSKFANVRAETTRASLLSGLILYNSFPAAADLIEDDIGGGFPDERSGFVVPGRQPLIDGSLQFFDAMEGSTTDHSVGDESEQAFHLVEPGTARGCEMKTEASPLLRL